MEKFRRTINSNLKNFTEVEIGDYKQVDFFHQVKLKKWDNESNFSLRLIQNYPVEYIDEGDKTDMVITLTKRVKKLSYSLVHKDVQFIKKVENKNSEVIMGERSPNSYVIFKKNFRKNFTGKTVYGNNRIGDIFAPKAVDDNGDWIYLDQNIVDDILIIDMDDKWLDTAKYPVKIY